MKRRRASSRDAPREATPWLTVAQAAAYWQIGKRVVYCEAKAGRLKVIFLGGRRETRTRREWLDEAFEALATTPTALSARRRRMA